MSYYQVAESCRFPASDWNYKWNATSPTICNSNRSSSPYFHDPSSESNQVPDTTFVPKLDRVKEELPEHYQQYKGQSSYAKGVFANVMPENYGKLNGWSCYSENRFPPDEYEGFPPSNKTEVPRYFENGFVKDKYDDICILSHSKPDNGTKNWSNGSGKDDYDDICILNHTKLDNPTRNWANGSAKDEYDDICILNHSKLNNGTKNWSNGSSKDEYDDICILNHTKLDSATGNWSNASVKDDYDDICILNHSKLDNGTKNWPNGTVKDEYDSSQNQMYPFAWNRHLIKSFIKDESDEFYGTSSQFKVYESLSGSNNLWLMTPPNIVKEEYDDDIIMLKHTQNNEHKTNLYQGGLADSNSVRRNVNVVNELSNDSVELLFERAGLEGLMQNSPDELLQIKEFDDLFTEDQSQAQEVKEETDSSGPEVNPVTFNRKHYKCSCCSFSTNGRERLNEHMEKLHTSSGYNMRSTRRRRLRNSVDKENQNVKEPPTKSKDKTFKCSECAYTTNHRERLKKHIEKKHFVETYNRYNSWDQGPKIQAAAVDNRNLNQNQSKKSGSKPHKCPQCSYSAHRNDRLMKHIAKIHSKNVCYKCSQCDFVSTYNREYYEHMKSHYGGPPFRCEACSYKSKLITAFIAHRVTHTGDRLFNCTLCSFSCKRKYHLKGHMISHSKEKNFLCPQCSKKYSYKCSLVRHLKTSCKRKPA